jgi:hypothetical protein
MENLCYFVNSRGILKSCDFHSKKPKSSCDNDNRYLYFMLANMFDGMSIYVCSDLLKFFVNTIMPKINKNFVLVSGDSDLSVPREAISLKELNYLISSPYLIKWFAQNTQMQGHPKIFQMPIGLDYHTISKNPSINWKLPEEGRLPGEQEMILVKMRVSMAPFYERIPKIYVHFSKSSDRFGDRKNSVATIPRNLLEINETFTPRTITWNNTIRYSFVLSPFCIFPPCQQRGTIRCQKLRLQS